MSANAMAIVKQTVMEMDGALAMCLCRRLKGAEQGCTPPRSREGDSVWDTARMQLAKQGGLALCRSITTCIKLRHGVL
jgi:hypothetical protein